MEYNDELWGRHRRAVHARCESMRQATRDQVGLSLAQKVPCSAPSQLLGLNQVVEIDRDRFIASVEPNVTMEALVQLTKIEGLIPTVIAPSRATTVADAFATATFGSSSFQFGTFDCAVLSLEAVLPDGQYVMAKLGDGDDADRLFEILGAPDSPALITLLEIALTPAWGYVEMTYWPVSSVSGARLRMEPKGPNSLILDRAAVDESTDFVDSVMFD
ncbi:FAD binding domain-containing protein [Pyrenophora tritici-repentis]|uniref:GlcD, FAD-FMN-containing dehydrogenase n=1 Tax=Pyrenophora tritici-repentis TaxID=45151 RepID=A0A317A8H3_9PLEO|nr:FAD binding domain-containing protein [Pyrenophora tritici-repentis]KAF7571189.1 GlcD, FAD-FMN-containing dehydrogenase [Pyrenophora tritici-repentis]KAI1561641.1 GlcD FAD FMN-containing dehydrogenase [Pyrenophora tritici-repentis]KAI1564693.1 GlcD FAD FMN-containing dehydrogenase [Pyrenophora tritici-repentis]KAI1593276.1 GlcD FAD FMN-containing dehydrogenase [Pyrenophora tritici-repentis]